MKSKDKSNVENAVLLDVDMIFATSWLAVSQLRNGVKIEDGPALYHKACQHIDHARQQLEGSKASPESIEQMLYALCALWDESVMNRGVQDDGYHQWLKSPLQIRYFNTLEAGEKLWERIHVELARAVPDIALLTCFHRVLLLGFGERFKEQSADYKGRQFKQEILTALERQVPAFTLNERLPLVIRRSSTKTTQWEVRAWWLGAIVFLVLMRWALDASLQNDIQRWLP